MYLMLQTGVLSESTARKIFGDVNPIDKAIKIGYDTARYIISGVMADVPGKFTFRGKHPDFLHDESAIAGSGMDEQQFQHLPSFETKYKF